MFLLYFMFSFLYLLIEKRERNFSIFFLFLLCSVICKFVLYISSMCDLLYLISSYFWSMIHRLIETSGDGWVVNTRTMVFFFSFYWNPIGPMTAFTVLVFYIQWFLLQWFFTSVNRFFFSPTFLPSMKSFFFIFSM